MRLSDKEKKILSVVEMNASISISEIANITGYRSHTVHYAIHKLEREFIIKKVPFVDMQKLGYLDFILFFSLSSTSVQKVNFLYFLIESSAVTWVGEIGGEYQYGVGMYVQHPSEFSNFLKEVSDKFGNIIFQKSFSLHTSFTRWNRGYIDVTRSKVSITAESTQDTENIDDVDRKILSEMAKQPSLSRRDIAQKVSMPFSTVNKRIHLLEKKDVIKGYTYLVDAQKLEMQSFELLIYAKGLNKELGYGLKKFAHGHHYIISFIECIGEWDFELGVEVKQNSDLTLILEKLYKEFGSQIQAIKMIPIFRNIKYLFYRNN